MKFAILPICFLLSACTITIKHVDENKPVQFITAERLAKGPIPRTAELDKIYLERGVHIDKARIIRILGGTTASFPFFYDDDYYIPNPSFERDHERFMRHLQGDGNNQTRSEQQWQPVLEMPYTSAEAPTSGLHGEIRNLESNLREAENTIAELKSKLRFAESDAESARADAELQKQVREAGERVHDATMRSYSRIR